MAANSQMAVILEQLMLGIVVVAMVVLLLPFLLVVAGVVGAAAVVGRVLCCAGCSGVLAGVSWHIRTSGSAAPIDHRAGSCR
jgi:hypothetical protein